MQGWQPLNNAQRQQKRQFEQFFSAFAASKPSQAARRSRQISSKDPARYLTQTRQTFKKPVTPPPESCLPPDLQLICSLQQDDGRWYPSFALYRALGGRIPAAPNGMSDWRWASALAVAYIKRSPQLFEITGVYVERAEEWAGDPDLQRTASAALPPLIQYNIADSAVDSGSWLKETYDMAKTMGYSALRPSTGTVSLPDLTTKAELQDVFRNRRAPEEPVDDEKMKVRAARIDQLATFKMIHPIRRALCRRKKSARCGTSGLRRPEGIWPAFPAPDARPCSGSMS